MTIEEYPILPLFLPTKSQDSNLVNLKWTSTAFVPIIMSNFERLLVPFQ